MRYYPTIKRLLDILLSLAALSILSPLFCFTILFIKLDSNGPAFFRQQRIGKDFRPFSLIKFRSMMHNPQKSQFNPGDESRVTRIGRFIRKTKLDELPELLNVLSGNMSIIGPRPEVEKYVRAYPEDFKVILKIRPGLSDYASIKYRDEETILASQHDPEQYYLQVILPDKLRLARSYVEDVSLLTDARIIMRTIRSIFWQKEGHNKCV